MSWLELGGPVMYVITGCSFVAWAIIVERLLFFRWMRKEGMEAAVNRILRGFLVKKGYEALLNVRGREEIYSLNRWLGALYVLSRVLPLLGLLGTVLGMVKVFQQVSVGNIGNPNALASGIWEALLTTVAGLGSAIPVMLFYSYLSSIAERIGVLLEKKVAERIIADEK